MPDKGREEEDAAAKRYVAPGMAVDSHGGPVIDPTKNVLDLVRAAVTRINDLRVQEMEHGREVRVLESKRLDDLRSAESRRVDEQAQLRADFNDKLTAKESNRIDAIRQVDVSVADAKAQSAQAAISALAATTALNAETLRNSQANLANTIAAQNADAFAGINVRLANLERASYEGKGKQDIADPAIASTLSALASQVKSLADAQVTAATAAAATSGKKEGIGAAWVMIIAIGSILVAAVVGLAAAYIERGTPTPQTVYLPAPAAAPTTPVK